MKKIIQVLFLLIVQTVVAQAQAPQILSPANNATVPPSFTLQIAAHPTAASMLVYVIDPNGYFTEYRQSGSGPYNIAVSGLRAATQYTIQVYALSAGGGTLGSTSIRVTTAPPLVITYPSNGATGLPLNFNVQVNAYTGASSVLVQWRPVGGAYNTTNQSVQTGTGPYSLPVSGLAQATSYDLRVRALDANGVVLTETTLRITTNANPTILSPANNATVPPSFTLQIAAHPTAASMLVYVIDPNGYFTEYRQSGSGPYNIAVSGLRAATQYTIQVYALSAGGGTLGSTSIRVTTAPPLVITYPSNGATGLPLNFNVQVNAYTGASSVLVQWRPVGGAYNTTNQSVQTGTGPYSLPVSGLAQATSYDLRVRALDANGVVLTETTLRITTNANPTILSPANNATGVPLDFTLQIAAHPTAASMLVYVIDPNGYFTEYRQSGSGPYNIAVSGLAEGTRYTIQVYALNAGGATLGSSSIVITTTNLPYVLAINGQPIDESTIVYLNQFEYTLTSSALRNISNYRWEFSKNEDFSTISRTINTASSTTLNLKATDLESGERYFVRVTAIRQNGAQVTGPLRSFYNALHPVTLYSPASTNRSTVRLWTAPVGNDEFALFQIDDDPNFNTPHVNPNNLGYGGNMGGGNSEYPFVSGNVFRSNSDWYWNSATQSGCFEPRCGTLSSRTYTYVAGLLPGVYYVRVRAVNLTRGQTGYWSTVGSFTVSLPPIQAPVVAIGPVVANPPLTYSNIDPRYVAFSLRPDPNYVSTGYDFQISKDNFATTVMNVENVLGVHYEIKGLEYNTTYQARARTYIKDDLNQNVVATNWYIITFTTQASPTGRTSFEDMASAQGAESNRGLSAQIYPNPFATSTSIALPYTIQRAKIRVTNVVGGLVEEIEASGGEVIELGEKWNKGMYIIQIISEDRKSTTYKVVKQ